MHQNAQHRGCAAASRRDIEWETTRRDETRSGTGTFKRPVKHNSGPLQAQTHARFMSRRTAPYAVGRWQLTAGRSGPPPTPDPRRAPRTALGVVPHSVGPGPCGTGTVSEDRRPYRIAKRMRGQSGQLKRRFERPIGRWSLAVGTVGECERTHGPEPRVMFGVMRRQRSPQPGSPAARQRGSTAAAATWIWMLGSLASLGDRPREMKNGEDEAGDKGWTMDHGPWTMGRGPWAAGRTLGRTLLGPCGGGGRRGDKDTREDPTLCLAREAFWVAWHEYRSRGRHRGFSARGSRLAAGGEGAARGRFKAFQASSGWIGGSVESVDSASLRGQSPSPRRRNPSSLSSHALHPYILGPGLGHRPSHPGKSYLSSSALSPRPPPCAVRPAPRHPPSSSLPPPPHRILASHHQSLLLLFCSLPLFAINWPPLPIPTQTRIPLLPPTLRG
ncbi:unnamed protein product [Cutaneotrichosporon oleaginosum]